MFIIRRLLGWGSSPPLSPEIDNYARVLVGDLTGRILTELELDVGPVAWRLNKETRVKFQIARSDPKAIEDYLRFGNRILVQFENGLPDWGGIIDPPRKWSKDGSSIEFTAYSGEQLLKQRQTGKARSFSSATVGYIYQSLIEDANVVADTGISIGDVWGGGDTHSPMYHFDKVLEKIQQRLTDRLSSADFVISASESGGYIVFTAHFYERRGSEKPNVALLEGHNLIQIELVEQGTIVNSWAIVGEGSTWGDERLVGYAEDADSIAEFGLREDSEVHSDVAEQASLDAIAANRLAGTARPHNMLALEAANLAPAAFSDYDVGDSVRVVLHSYGFGGYDKMVRVIAREYAPSAGTCTLVVREEE